MRTNGLKNCPRGNELIYDISPFGNKIEFTTYENSNFNITPNYG